MRVPVFFERFEVGALTVAGDGTLSFAYDPRWLATRQAFPLSVTMPLGPERFPDAVIAPWIANLLPEERQLTALARSLGLSAGDTLALLREIGGDTAGALSFEVPGPPEDWAYRPLSTFYGLSDPGQALDRHFQDLRQRPFLAGEDGVRLSLAGGQEKTALAVIDPSGQPRIGPPRPEDRLAVPMRGAPSTVILKPDNPDLPGIVENEAYCLTLAARIGIAAAEVFTVPGQHRLALGVVRYDRRITRTGRLRRLHQEDFAQANALPPGLKYERGTLRGLTLEGLLRTGRHLPPRDDLALMDQFIFNVLVANTDAHAKNYSMLLGESPQLAPLYDVSCTLPWPHLVKDLAQNICGRKRRPYDLTPAHWSQIAREAGRNPSTVRDRVLTLIDAMVAQMIATEETVCAMPGTTPALVRQVARAVDENAQRLRGRF
ncbi:type II toxin-antitoxin system HipA family toxin [Pseudooceanicola sp. CBS1P-1]|nr:type II toxin-antitoxin system HipA family toxin [Pseudooceanicola endophyticus]